MYYTLHLNSTAHDLQKVFEKFIIPVRLQKVRLNRKSTYIINQAASACECVVEDSQKTQKSIQP